MQAYLSVFFGDLIFNEKQETLTQQVNPHLKNTACMSTWNEET